MKSLHTIYHQFEHIADRWISDIDKYTDEQFLKKPDEHQWSIGQVYVHLIQSANSFHLKQIQLCAERKGKELSGGKKVPGRISFTLGMFPPVRIHVPPSPSYTPGQPADKNEVRRQLQELKQTMKDHLSKAERAPLLQKTEHPAFGYLNAREWFHLVLMHFRHHRRQQARVNTFLGVTL